jgi:hypothetical protein
MKVLDLTIGTGTVTGASQMFNAMLQRTFTSTVAVSDVVHKHYVLTDSFGIREMIELDGATTSHLYLQSIRPEQWSTVGVFGLSDNESATTGQYEWVIAEYMHSHESTYVGIDTKLRTRRQQLDRWHSTRHT